MFRQYICHPQGAYLRYFANYISTIASLVKINKSIKMQKKQQFTF
jgi:hypothetical protein